MAMIEWQTARENGDDAKRQESFAEMTKNKDANYESNQRIKAYGEKIDSCVPWIVLSGASAIFFSTVFYAYVRHKKSKKHQTDTEANTKTEKD